MAQGKIAITLIIIIFFSTFGCKTKRGIMREIKPVETLKIQTERGRCAMIKSMDYEISIEPINKSHWEMIDESQLFLKNNKNLSNTRIPRFAFFQLILSNIGRNPIEIKSISLNYNNNIKRTNLSIKEVKNKCKSPVFSIFKFNKLLSARRLFSDSICPKKIDYKKDTIDYKLKFIIPQDQILLIVAFDWIPVEYRKFSLIVKLKSLNNDNSINFDFKKFEYRTRGNVFIKPEEEEIKEFEYED